MYVLQPSNLVRLAGITNKIEMNNLSMTAWWPMVHNFQSKQKMRTRFATCPQKVKGPSFCSILNASYYNSLTKMFMLVMHLVCVFECLCLSWPHAFWAKINKINKREFLGVSKETSPISDPGTSNSNIMNRQTSSSSSKKWQTKRKRKLLVALKHYT